MNDQEKSVMLARAMGLEVYESKEAYFKAGMPHAIEYDVNIEHPAYFHAEHRLSNVLPNYYDPVNMALAWTVLQHFKHEGGNLRDTDYDTWVDEDNAADAQRTWLDKIFYKSIEAGIIELEAEHDHNDA